MAPIPMVDAMRRIDALRKRAEAAGVRLEVQGETPKAWPRGVAYADTAIASGCAFSVGARGIEEHAHLLEEVVALVERAVARCS